MSDRPPEALPALTLAQAQRLILAQVHPTETEFAPLGQALGRIAARALTAPMPVPAFARTAMDGFAVASSDLARATPDRPARLPVVGEIAAGTTDIRRLGRGQARRIMTGGAVPPGADQVVPLEQCREEEGWVLIDHPGRPHLHIRARGTDCKKGETIVRAGQPIHPEHLPLLAEAGVHRLEVFRTPRVGILCTGSELLELGATPREGQIIGGNRFLLDGLIRRAGGEPVDLGLVADRIEAVCAALAPRRDSPQLDLIVTTGGMGPGKYDLMERVLTRLDATILYRSLKVRPGRATSLALIGRTPLFALPGPPPAVHLLFHETLRPALRKAQGYSRSLPLRHQATLTEPLSLKRSGLLNLKGGVMRCRQEGLVVRPATRNEPINAIILIPPSRRQIGAGEKVTVHPTCGEAEE